MLLPPEPVLSIFWLTVGLVFGSFLNVCIYRLPLGKSVVHPGSACPSCQRPIRWYQNIPVLSWIVLRAKCAHCGTRISARYPFIEMLTGLLVLGLWWLYGPTPQFWIATPFALVMVVLFFTDFDHQLLPDTVTLTGFVLGLVVAWFNPFLGEPGWSRIWGALSGALVSGLPLAAPDRQPKPPSQIRRRQTEGLRCRRFPLVPTQALHRSARRLWLRPSGGM